MKKGNYVKKKIRVMEPDENQFNLKMTQHLHKNGLSYGFYLVLKFTRRRSEIKGSAAR